METILEGKFLAKVVGGEARFVKVDATEDKPAYHYVAATFEVIGPTDAGATVQWKGRLTDAALEYTKKDLAKMGWSGSYSSNPITGLGKTVELVLAGHEFKGKTYQDVKFINTPGGAAGRKETLASVADMAAIFGGKSNEIPF